LNVGKNTTLFIKIISSEVISQLELQQIKLLEALLTHAGSRDRSLAIQIGEVLRQVRQSLNLSQEDLAVQAGTTRFGVWKWESGAQAPSIPALYRWCQALGLVCPPKTALVRVVDLSPELLRFLQEDPTRLQALTPDQFERFTAERLDRMGYNVTLTGATNRKDGGIDLIAVPKSANVGSIVIAGQVKHHRGDQKTGRDAVDRMLAWKDSYFGVGLLVTNTSFTRDAVWTAQQERNARFLRLRDFTDLKRWLEGRFGEEEDWREIPDRIELAPGVVIEIPRPCITSVFQDQRVLRDAGPGIPSTEREVL
jgi:transcriptional regulator with XRE-family HTH domain